MRQYLLPVWGHSRFTAAAKDIGLPPDQWLDQSALGYGHCLVSYVHWKMPFIFPEGCYIFGDSGGFSLRSPTMAHKLKIDPVDVLRWQEATCTVGCILDLPPKGLTQRIWHRGLDVTVEHTKRALPVYLKMRKEGTAFRWWGVLHGNNEEEVREYHKAISKVYPFNDEGEGWAIRPEPFVNSYATARSLRILQHLKITRAHFLAATSQDVISVLLALGPEAGLQFLTYDSAYAVKSGFNRHTFKPENDGATFTIITEEGDENYGRQWLLKECPCPVCAHMRVRSQECDKGRKELHQVKFAGWWSTWLQFHNIYIQQKLVEKQAALAEQDGRKFLREQLPQDAATILRIFAEDGHEPSSITPRGTSVGLLDFLKK